MQYKHKDDPDNSWEDTAHPSWNFAINEYRRKPEPKIVPWTIEDITPEIANSFLSTEPGNGASRILSFGSNGISCYCQSQFENDKIENVDDKTLFKLGKYSTDLKTWKPCGKVVS